MRDSSPSVVPAGTTAALPDERARARRASARRTSQPLWNVALPTLAMSATKLPCAIVSISGSRCAAVETSAPRPIRAPSSRSHTDVYSVEYSEFVYCRLISSSESANHFRRPSIDRAANTPGPDRGETIRRPMATIRHTVSTNTGPTATATASAGPSPKNSSEPHTSRTAGSRLSTASSSSVPTPRAATRSCGRVHDGDGPRSVSSATAGSAGSGIDGDPAQCSPAGTTCSRPSADCSPSTASGPMIEPGSSTEFAPTCARSPTVTGPTTTCPSCIVQGRSAAP